MSRCCFNGCANKAKKGQRFCGLHALGIAAATAPTTLPDQAVALPTSAAVPTDSVGRRLVGVTDMSIPASVTVSTSGIDGPVAVAGPATLRCYTVHDPNLLAERAALLAENAELRRQLQEGTTARAQHERDFTVIRTETEALRRDNEAVKAENTALKKRVATLELAIAELKGEVGELKGEVGELKGEVVERRSKLSTLFAVEAIQFLLRHFKRSMCYNAVGPNLMTTAQKYAAGTLPDPDRARYVAFLRLHPQLNDQNVLQTMELLMHARLPIAHPPHAGRANADQLRGEIVAALEAEGDLDASAMEVVDKLVEVLIATPVQRA